jgi:hypothetical protein
MRGNLVVGTGGQGWLALAPFCVANDLNSIAYTNSLYTGSTFTQTNPTTGVVFQNDPQIPYLSTQALNTRVVGTGIRIRYVGTELARGGTILPTRALPQNDSIAGQNYVNTLERPDHVSRPVDRKWHGVVYSPMFSQATQFTLNNSNIDNDDLPSNMKMGIWITGTPGNIFEFDIVRFFEAVPDGGTVSSIFTVQGVSRSHTDLPGLSVVRDFLGSLTASDWGPALYDKGIVFAKGAALAAVAAYTGLPAYQVAAGPKLLGWH